MLALAALLALVVLACTASAASAEAWGQRETFTPWKEFPEEVRRIATEGAKFAAAPNGVYYVLARGEHRQFVLQRISENEVQAETEFEPTPEEAKQTEKKGAAAMVDTALAVTLNPTIEPGRERVYVLFVYQRPGPTESEEIHELDPLDSEMLAAGSVYAFEYKEKQLASAKTEEIKVGSHTIEIPAPALDFEAMHANAEEKRPKPEELKPTERPLLDPRGIAVDPATGDLAITGNEDQAPMESVQNKEEEKQCRAAVQFVKTGESEHLKLSLGARYVDEQAKVLFGYPLTGDEESGCGEAESDEESGVGQAPASPVFAPDGSVLGYDEAELIDEPELKDAQGKGLEAELEGIIWQLTQPLSQAQEETPGVVKMSPKLLFVPATVEPFEVADAGGEKPAPVMSLVPTNSTEGTIYLAGEDGFTGQPAPTVLRYSHPPGGEPSITEVGWIAGAKESPSQGTEPCNLHRESQGEGPTMLGGLSSGGFLALAFYEEEEGFKGQRYAEVLRFSEGGSTDGCPKVSVTKPVAHFRGLPTTEVEPGAELAITSGLGEKEQPSEETKVQAAAKSVTWTVRFTSTDGASEETSYNTDYENELPNWVEVLLSEGKLPLLPSELTFDYTPNKAGTYEITDVVHTDDLADEIAQPEEDGKPAAAKLTVKAGTGGLSGLTVKPRIPEPPAVRAHEQEATLSAEVNQLGKEKVRIKRVVWEFEGSKDEQTSTQELPATVQIKHVFSRCATARSTKCKIVVTVEAETASGSVQSGSAHFEMTVLETTAEEEAERTSSAGSSSGGSSGGGSSGGGTPGPGGPPGRSSVRAYKASLSGSSLSVSPTGAVAMRITCPSGGACAGTLTLRTLNAVSATPASLPAHVKASTKPKKKILTLASGSYSLTGGSRSVTLHLNSAARALLRRSHGVVRAKLTILSRGVDGQRNVTTTDVVTLRLDKARKVSHKG